VAGEQFSQACFDAACRYLSYRPRSEMEIKMRLRKRGFEDPPIETALQSLREQRLVDDLAFAQFWKDNRESFSPRSRALLQRELKEKGVAPHIIAEIADGIDDEASAYQASQRKMKAFASLDYKDFRYRLSAFLRRRGFSYTITHHTINQLWQEIGG
jgi:regulatory protein